MWFFETAENKEKKIDVQNKFENKSLVTKAEAVKTGADSLDAYVEKYFADVKQ